MESGFNKKKAFKNPFAGNIDKTDEHDEGSSVNLKLETDGNEQQDSAGPGEVNNHVSEDDECEYALKGSDMASEKKNERNFPTKEMVDSSKQVVKKKKKAVPSFQAPGKTTQMSSISKEKVLSQVTEQFNNKEREDDSSLNSSTSKQQTKMKKKGSGFHDPPVSAEAKTINKEVKKKAKKQKMEDENLKKENKEHKKKENKKKAKGLDSDVTPTTICAESENQKNIPDFKESDGNVAECKENLDSPGVDATTTNANFSEKNDSGAQPLGNISANEFISKPKKKKLHTSFQAPGKNVCSKTATGQDETKKEKMKRPKKMKDKDIENQPENENLQKNKKKTERKKKLTSELPPLTREDYDEIFRAVLERSVIESGRDLLTDDTTTMEEPLKQTDCNKPVRDMIDVQMDEDEKDNFVKDKCRNYQTENLKTDISNSYNTDDVEHDDAIENVRGDTSSDVEENQVPVDFEGHDGSNIQQVNEITPEGSEMNDEDVLAPEYQETPPIKKKQKKTFQAVPVKQLEPRQLQFPKSAFDSVKKKKNYKQSKTDNQHVELKKKQKLNRKQMFVDREYSNSGTWVQCCECQKWRFLSEIGDPTEIPDKWLCEMNTDENFNACEKTEQHYNEDDHIFTKFSEGSVVWARIAGYPWWPALIEVDPDTESFYEVATTKNQSPTHYHVVFFDEKVTRAWVKSPSIIQFKGKEHLDMNLKSGKSCSFKKEIGAAKVNAVKALELSIKDRLKKYSFGVRYKGKWGRSIEENEIEDIDLRPKKKQKVRGKPKKEKSKKTIVNEMIDVLDDTTVDEILDNPEDVLKGFEEVLESIDSDNVSDEESEYVPSDREERNVAIPSEERSVGIKIKSNLKIMNKEKKSKTKCRFISERKNADKKMKKEKNVNKTKRTNSKTEVCENEIKLKKHEESKQKGHKSMENVSKKRKMTDCKIKDVKYKKEKKLENKEIKKADCDILEQKLGDDNGTKQEEQMVESLDSEREITTFDAKIKFDSDVFTMEMHSEEVEGDLEAKAATSEVTLQNEYSKTKSKSKDSFVPSESTDHLKDTIIRSEDLQVDQVNKNLQTVSKVSGDINAVHDEQTVPSFELQAEEEQGGDFDDELSINIPIITLSKPVTSSDIINPSIAVLIANNDDGEDSDPFDMEE